MVLCCKELAHDGAGTCIAVQLDVRGGRVHDWLERKGTGMSCQQCCAHAFSHSVRPQIAEVPTHHVVEVFVLHRQAP